MSNVISVRCTPNWKAMTFERYECYLRSLADRRRNCKRLMKNKPNNAWHYRKYFVAAWDACRSTYAYILLSINIWRNRRAINQTIEAFVWFRIKKKKNIFQYFTIFWMNRCFWAGFTIANNTDDISIISVAYPSGVFLATTVLLRYQ